MSLRLPVVVLLVGSSTLPVVVESRPTAQPDPAVRTQEAPPRPDYLTFARGAVPISIGGPGAELGANAEHHVRMIDGDPTPFGYLNTPEFDAVTEFVYELPAPTTFDRLAVPMVLEVPSAYETFARTVEVWGSSVGPADGWVRLASATLETHGSRNEVTELAIEQRVPVRWVRLSLQGGIDIGAERMAIDFSEIIGNGTQEDAALSERFTGAWDSRVVKMELSQEGPLVEGCYDRQGHLTGTVEGNVLRARGEDLGGSRTVSLFVLSVPEDGTLTGVRSTNGGPFRLYEGGPVDAVPRLDCTQPPPPLGCGSIIHGIGFDFDSDVPREDATPILDALFEGLTGDPAASIVVVGHTSSEGSDDYNLDLSLRRAAAVVSDLVRRGLAAQRVRPRGMGEDDPMASNANEAGRALNRRVEIECS